MLATADVEGHDCTTVRGLHLDIVSKALTNHNPGESWFAETPDAQLSSPPQNALPLVEIFYVVEPEDQSGQALPHHRLLWKPTVLLRCLQQCVISRRPSIYFEYCRRPKWAG